MTTSSRPAPAALSTAVTLRRTCAVCSATVVPTTAPVSGSKGSCPETCRTGPLRMPWDSGAGRAGAFSVVMTVLVMAFLEAVVITEGGGRQTPTASAPGLAFPAAGVVDLGPLGVDGHGGPALGVVGVPAGVAGGGEPDPGLVHAVREIRGGLVGAEQGAGADQLGPVREVEDEGQLDRVGGAELSVQGLGAPGELVRVGGGLRMGGMGAGQSATARAEQGVGHDGGPQFRVGGLGAGLAVGLDEPRRIPVRARRRLVDVGCGRGGVLAPRGQVEVALLGVGADEQVDVGGEAGGDGCGGLSVEDEAEGAEAD